MKVFYGMDNLPSFVNPVVTIGSYDGVHYGHRVMLKRVMDRAAAINGESVVITFSPHPRQVLSHGADLKLLNTLKEKIFLLSSVGIDNLIILPFTEGFASMRSYDFVKNILVNKIGLKWLIVGYDHRFGHDQEGNFTFVRNMQTEFGFNAEEVSRHDMNESKVSSTEVRRALSDGDMKRVNALLGSEYMLIADVRSGVVKVGDGAKLLPPFGRYAVTVRLNGEEQYDDTLAIDRDGLMRLENAKGNLDDVMIVFKG